MGVWAVVIGALAGLAAGMNLLAVADPHPVTPAELTMHLMVGAALGAVVLGGLRFLTRLAASRVGLTPAVQQRFLRHDRFSYLPALVTWLGAFGVQMIPPVVVGTVLTCLLLKALALYAALPADDRAHATSSLGFVAFLFLISGFAALIYQIVWQRTLFAAFGVNIESITIIVSLFMFGLGIGSLVGGSLASRFPRRAPVLFLACELGIGAFGLISLPLIQWVSTRTLHGSLVQVSLAIYALLCIPTIFMGATLPVLVDHLYRHYRNVGQSVGLLYCINTVGSALACFITADLLFVLLGQQGAIHVAAVCNLCVGLLVSRYARRIARRAPAASVAQEPYNVR